VLTATTLLVDATSGGAVVEIAAWLVEVVVDATCATDVVVSCAMVKLVVAACAAIDAASAAAAADEEDAKANEDDTAWADANEMLLADAAAAELLVCGLAVHCFPLIVVIKAPAGRSDMMERKKATPVAVKNVKINRQGILERTEGAPQPSN